MIEYLASDVLPLVYIHNPGRKQVDSSRTDHLIANCKNSDEPIAVQMAMAARIARLLNEDERRNAATADARELIRAGRYTVPPTVPADVPGT